jgi:hypothetical protein
MVVGHADLGAPPGDRPRIKGRRGRIEMGAVGQGVLAAGLRDRRCRDQERDALVAFWPGADYHIGTERGGDFLGEELAEGPAGDAADDLAH